MDILQKAQLIFYICSSASLLAIIIYNIFNTYKISLDIKKLKNELETKKIKKEKATRKSQRKRKR